MVKTTCVQRSVPVSRTPISLHSATHKKHFKAENSRGKKTVALRKTSQSLKRNINFLLMLSAFIPFLICSQLRVVKLLKNATQKKVKRNIQ